jgi:type III pantothenate kinase
MRTSLTLLIDAGNSSIKWRFISDRDALRNIAETPAHHLDNQQVTADALRRAWQEAMNRLSPDPAIAVRGLTVAWLSVGPPAVREAVIAAFRDLTGNPPPAAYQSQPSMHLDLSASLPTAQAVSLTNRYQDPGQLGADRWAAALGLSALGICTSGDRVLVISAGTATTADVVTCVSPHDLIFEGGWILPGARLMHQSLLQNTRDLNYDWQDSDLGLNQIPRASPQAIGQGIALAQVGWVESLVRRHQIAGIVLSGGNAVFWKKALQQVSDARTSRNQPSLAHEFPSLGLAGMAALALAKPAGA